MKKKLIFSFFFFFLIGKIAVDLLVIMSGNKHGPPQLSMHVEINDIFTDKQENGSEHMISSF